jgi:hypothetical protein
MIITNWIAKWIVGLAAKSTPGTVGITLWPFIFIWPAAAATDDLIAHERVHMRQWRRYWIVGFIPVYLYQLYKYGYDKMPLEEEARHHHVVS